MSLTARVVTQIIAVVTGAPDVGQSQFSLNEKDITEFSNGTGAGQANLLFSDTRTIAASGSDNLDLAGSLVDALGNPAVFAAVKAFRVRAAAGNTNNVVIGGAVSNPFVGPFADASDKIAIVPGGSVTFERDDAAGWAVTAGSADVLLVANSGSGTSVTYTIEILGEG